jgi:hypothetical protein
LNYSKSTSWRKLRITIFISNLLKTLKSIGKYVVVALLIMSCGTETYELHIDNPNTENLYISVNDKEYVIFGLDMLVLELAKGSYQFRGTNETKSLNFSQQQKITSDGILNPSKASYVLWTDSYSTETLKPIEHIDSIQGNSYTNLQLEVLDSFFIPKEWDYALFESWKGQLQYHSIKTIEKSKIYRLSAFEKTWGFQSMKDSDQLSLKTINSELLQIKKQLKSLQNVNQ